MADNVGYGLGTIYRQPNPVERRISVASKVAENAGFARPLIYAMMGKDMAAAEEWDAGQAELYNRSLTANQELANRKQGFDEVDKTLSRIVTAAKDNPQLATDLIDMASNQYPQQLGGLKGFKVVANSKDQFMFVETGDGSKVGLNLPALAEALKDPNSKDEKGNLTPEAAAKIVTPIGGPKPPPQPTEWSTRNKAAAGDEAAQKAITGAAKEKKDIKATPGGSAGGGKDTRTGATKEYDRYLEDAKSKGQTPMSFEDFLRTFKKVDPELNAKPPGPVPPANRKPLNAFGR